jgi:hypothetical protein
MCFHKRCIARTPVSLGRVLAKRSSTPCARQRRQRLDCRLHSFEQRVVTGAPVLWQRPRGAIAVGHRAFVRLAPGHISPSRHSLAVTDLDRRPALLPSFCFADGIRALGRGCVLSRTRRSESSSNAPCMALAYSAGDICARSPLIITMPTPTISHAAAVWADKRNTQAEMTSSYAGGCLRPAGCVTRDDCLQPSRRCMLQEQRHFPCGYGISISISSNAFSARHGYSGRTFQVLEPQHGEAAA